MTPPPAEASTGPPRSHGIILLVDDSPDDVTPTRRALLKATDGEQAIDYLLPADGERIIPELVLLDVPRAIRGDERTRYPCAAPTRVPAV